jgi:hypothetical protein
MQLAAKGILPGAEAEQGRWHEARGTRQESKSDRHRAVASCRALKRGDKPGKTQDQDVRKWLVNRMPKLNGGCNQQP